jgi:hypothetical protein
VRRLKHSKNSSISFSVAMMATVRFTFLSITGWALQAKPPALICPWIFVYI